ncbi:hypothetical protein ZWY2020_039687 [Hordeum vulgare]|nr:hypothetical protein ZWY2020_039687 [Hordeum vulgare]
MQMDDLPWPRNPRPQRADDIAGVAGWSSTCEVRRTVTQPAAPLPFRIIRPWPGLRGAHGTRRPTTPKSARQRKLSPPRSQPTAWLQKAPTPVALDRSQAPNFGAGPSSDSTMRPPDAIVEGIGTQLRAAPTPSAQPDLLLLVGSISLDAAILAEVIPHG